MKSASGTFKGFPAEGLAFLRELKKNNNREWFTPKLDQYKTAVRAPMLELVPDATEPGTGIAYVVPAGDARATDDVL